MTGSKRKQRCSWHMIKLLLLQLRRTKEDSGPTSTTRSWWSSPSQPQTDPSQEPEKQPKFHHSRMAKHKNPPTSRLKIVNGTFLSVVLRMRHRNTYKRSRQMKRPSSMSNSFAPVPAHPSTPKRSRILRSCNWSQAERHPHQYSRLQWVTMREVPQRLASPSEETPI